MIIGLAGYAQSGKTEAAKVLAKAGGMAQINFADALRSFVRALDPWVADPQELNWQRWSDLEPVMGYEVMKQETEARNILIQAGQGARDHLHPDVWVDAWWHRARGEKHVVVADVRYVNEAMRINRLGGTVWYIHRPGVDAVHETERESIERLVGYGVQRSLTNDGDLSDWKLRVLGAFEDQKVS